MTVVPWPEWLPDQADFGNAGSPNIKNCIPLTPRSYGPMPSAVPHSLNTLSERCQGSYAMKAADGSIYVFAGDRQKLYMLPPGGSRTLADVSRATGGAYATTAPSSGGHWSMTSFGTRIIAANGVDPMQTLMLPVGASPAFTPLSATAPVAKYVATVKDFLFAANTIDGVGGPVPYRVWWSGINDPTNWPTPGSITALQVMSDYQDLQQTDLGNIMGLQSGFAQGSDVAVFCERGIYTGQFVGPPLLFNFRVAQGAGGTISPLSIVQGHAQTNTGATVSVCYYLGESGFAVFDGSTSTPIGAQKFDRAFFRDLDDAYVGYVQGTADPRSRAVLWAYPSVGSAGLFNRVLVYNYELSRGTIIELEPASYLEWLSSAMFGTGYTLDNIDGFGTLDTIAPPFDDPFWTGNAASRLMLFDKDHRLGIGGGPAFAPTLETAEMQPNEGRRAWVQMTRPLIDGGIATVAVGHRERLTEPVIWEAPVAINALGDCPQRVTGRYLRFRLTMPAGQGFHHLQGIDIRMRPEAALR